MNTLQENIIAIIFAVTLALNYHSNMLADDHIGPFGIGSCHINNRSTQDYARWIPQMENIGLIYYRSCQTHWGGVEPTEGQWKWDVLDEQMSYMADHNFTFGGTLIGNPEWNKKDKRGYMPVNNLTGWSNYVSKVVGHTKGKIKYWEVWNEPPNFTGKDQTPADYARLVASAYDAAKAANPDCMVGLAAKSVHINYLEQVIKAGAKDHFDYITLHPYELLDGIADNIGTEPLFMHIVPTLRKMLAAQNPAKTNVPVIFTELGCDSRKGADTQAHALVKAYTMSIAQGVSCVHWFEGMDGDSGPLGLLKRDGTPRPAYTAMAQMIKYLGQHPEYLGWVQLNNRHPGFAFQGATNTVLVAWAHKGTTDDILFGQKVCMVNPLTGETTNVVSHTLTKSPILLCGIPDQLLKQASKTEPLPWGGDYSQSNSVSIIMGDEHAENGLHTLSGDAVAKAVIGYGGSARAGDVPGGNMFVVDPGFMSYTTEPIEITAVVRRNEDNVNAGFKLVYESTDGFKTAGGWYTVPDNTKWHTVKWRIDDAQFVSYWGYHFSLVSDGNKFNKYYIQSVTVTKTAR